MSFIVFNCYVVEWVDIFTNPVFKNPGIIILATISDIFPENPLINLFIYYSAQPVSILTFTGFEKLFQAALTSRSMDHTVKHTHKKDLFPWPRLKRSWETLSHGGQIRCKQKRMWWRKRLAFSWCFIWASLKDI